MTKADFEEKIVGERDYKLIPMATFSSHAWGFFRLLALQATD